MSKLQYLELSDNSLLALTFTKNWVPPFQLRYIGLRSCMLGPTFPKWLRTQNFFDELDISNAGITDMVPKWFWNISSLREMVSVNISYNNLYEKIPTSMGSLDYLHALLLRNNSLTNEIPLSLRSCTKLVMLDMAENRLSGPIPTWIGSKLQDLKFLSLRRNHFNGSLPLEICHLRSIRLLDLSLNNLSGKIPKCIKSFTSMAQKTSSTDYLSYSARYNRYSSKRLLLNALLMWKGSEQMFKNIELLLLKSIDLSSNHFSEEIPVEIEKLLELVSLNLSRNNLTGKIPSNIGKLTSLEFLDLSRNQLVDSIPLSLTQIDRLTMLDLSHNNLSGEIPMSTQLQSFDASSYEDNLDLCGPPLVKLCNKGGAPSKAKVEVGENEYSLFTDEFYISMAFGFVISFWVVFGSILLNRSWRYAYFKFLNNLSDNIYVKVALLLKVTKD
ncbi:Protein BRASSINOSTEROID INSENSITIVE 1, partial [Mucuna pruriens]